MIMKAVLLSVNVHTCFCEQECFIAPGHMQLPAAGAGRCCRTGGRGGSLLAAAVAAAAPAAV